MQATTRTEWGVRAVDLQGREYVYDYDDRQDAWEHLGIFSPGDAVLVSRTVTATAWEPHRRSLFPVPGARVTCGRRAWLPKAQRVHDWVPLGPDIRNCGRRGFLELEIFACRGCGADKAVEA
jgi:hypothetical protein